MIVYGIISKSMKKMNYIVPDSKLEVGKSYNLIIEKKIALPDNKNFYIVIDPNNKKHLLAAEFYKNYELDNKKEIICNVDEINCTGKIFFEPEHPYLKTGNYYKFNVLESSKAKDKKDNKFIKLKVKDYKNLIYTAISNVEIKETPKVIKAKIKRISKGRLYLEM